jgi:hypothetical protein
MHVRRTAAEAGASNGSGSGSMTRCEAAWFCLNDVAQAELDGDAVQRQPRGGWRESTGS